jgi:hypothetical protein
MTTLRAAAPMFLAAALAAAALSVAPVASAAPGPVPSAPCYNGIAPFNPYVDNCAIPSRPPHIMGAAPDQTAILNCSVGSQVLRAICLSQYVNGGPYAGIAIGRG